MDGFEGYVGIRLWDGQVVDDIIFFLLMILFITFALVYRTNYQLFLKMLHDVVFIKERSNLFEKKKVGNEWLFHNFMNFQALFLCSVGLFSIARIYGYVDHLKESAIWFFVGMLMLLVLLFYCLKQCFYVVFGCVFVDKERYKFWKSNYNAVIGTWGVMQYIPVLWMAFVATHPFIPIAMFVFLYLLCRFAIIYKTMRIFYKNNASLLYISLYLCSQEIIPLLFMYKGIIYLYNFIGNSAIWH